MLVSNINQFKLKSNYNNRTIQWFDNSGLHSMERHTVYSIGFWLQAFEPNQKKKKEKKHPQHSETSLNFGPNKVNEIKMGKKFDGKPKDARKLENIYRQK